jgi:hypothetical protein
MTDEDQPEQHYVDFTIEVLSVAGLPKPLATAVELSGFVEEPQRSVDLKEASTEPGPWSFGGHTSVTVSKELALETVAWRARPRPKLLDLLVGEQLIVKLLDVGNDYAEVGFAATYLQEFVFDDLDKQYHLDLQLNDGYTTSTEGVDEAAAPIITVRIQASERIGLEHCHEDFQDWTVLSVTCDGIYALPSALQDPDNSLGAASAGKIGDHPFAYNFRIMNCKFDDGYLMKPEVEEEENAEGAPPAEGAEAEGGEGAEGEGDGEQAEPVKEEEKGPELRVDLPTFREGLQNIGYTQCDDDGPEAFKFMDMNNNGTVGIAEFCEIQALDTPADLETMCDLRTYICKEYSNLRAAFDEWRPDGNEEVPKTEFIHGAKKCGFEGNAAGAFISLDMDRNDHLSWSEFQTLHLFAALLAVGKVEQTRIWMLQKFGNMMTALQQIDLNASGRVSREEWDEAIQKFEYTDKDAAKATFNFMDHDCSQIVGPKQFHFLEKFDGKRFMKDLQKFRNMLFNESGDLALSYRQFLPANQSEQAIADYNAGNITTNLCLRGRDFKAACKRKGWEKISLSDPLVIFNFLDEAHTGFVKESEFLLLRAFNSSAAGGGVARFKTFIMEKFPDLHSAFNLMFGDPTVFYETAESKMPYVEFAKKEIRLYKGREWVQQLYNIILDPRGHPLDPENTDPPPYGIWLYFFPRCLDHTPTPVDYRELAPGPAQDMAKLARYHHSQMFVDLRKLRINNLQQSAEAPQQVTVRAHMSRNQKCPSDVFAEGNFDQAPFEQARTYIKLTLTFSPKRLQELCPRDIPPLPNLFIPDPPGEKGPQTPMEVFEDTVKTAVGKLTKQFAKACCDRGLMHNQVLGPGGLLSEYQLLGKDVRRREFLRWIKADGEGRDALQELAEEFRISLSRVVRKEGRGVPECAMHGDERDIMYSEMWKKLLGHVVGAINSDVGVQMWRRDAKLWKHKPLYGDGDENFFEAEDLAIQQRERDKNLQRLIYECEMYSAHDRATVFYKEKLELPFNKKNFEQWYNYARFLMRCGQRQVEAENALRYAISLKGIDKCDSQALLFLACTFINKTGPSSVPHEERFEMAKCLFSIYLSRDPADPVANFFFYLMYAVQYSDTGDETCKANAAKFLAISKAEPNFFTAILPSLKPDLTPNFPELDALYQQELAARGEEGQTEPEVHVTPPAWMSAEYPVFEKFKNFHALPAYKDEAILDSIDRILLFGMPRFTRYLLTEAPTLYSFIEEKSLKSERCKMQLIKARMMLMEWEGACENCASLLAEQERNCEAWILYGELLFRCALDTEDPGKKDEKFLESEAAFQKAVAFLKLHPPDKAEREQMTPDEKTSSETEIPNRDPVIQLRLGAIHYHFAEKSNFTDEKEMHLSKESYKASLLLVETAEAWRNAGVCAFRLAQIAKSRGDAAKEDVYYAEARECLKMANEKDNTRPKIWAWLCICCVEGGLSNQVVQSYRFVMERATDVEWETLLELAQRFLRFSDPANAAYEGGPKFVRAGLYAKEAQEIVSLVLKQMDAKVGATPSNSSIGEARSILGQAFMWQGNMSQAFVELRAALPFLDADERKQNFVADLARRCAAEIPEDPLAFGQIEQDMESAKKRRGLLDATRCGDLPDSTRLLDQTAPAPVS